MALPFGGSLHPLGTRTPSSPRLRVPNCALQAQHHRGAGSPSKACGVGAVALAIAPTLSSAGTGTQRRSAASNSEMAAYVTRVLKEDVSDAPVKTLA